MGSVCSRQLNTAKIFFASVLIVALNLSSTGIAFAQVIAVDALVNDTQTATPAETPDTAPEAAQPPTTEFETTPVADDPAAIDASAEAPPVIDAAAAPATTEPDSNIKEPDSENPPEEFSTQSAIGDTTINSSAAVTPLPSLEKLRPNLNDGSLSIPYNLIIPPGRNGLQPYVSLVYNSQNFERRNQLGFGWSLSIPYIKRLNKTGIDQLYGTTTFYSSMDGELVQVGTSTSYRPRVDNGSYHVYQFASSTHWQMTDKNGTTYTYGQNSQARYENPSDTSKKYQWMLETAYDRNNNFISYTYTKDNNELYPSNINYTGASSTAGIFDVAFTTESRPDPEVSYEAGYLIKTQYRIKEISASVSSNWRRKYALVYANGDNGNRSLLTSITESGRDSSGNTVTKPSTQFSYAHATKTWTDATSQWTYPEAFFAIAGVGGDLGVRTLDVNGDGLTDILRSHTYPNGCGSTCYFNKVYLNNGSSFVLDSSISVPEYVTSFQASQGVVFLDANRDGLPDLVRAWSNGVQDIQKLYLATTTAGTSTLTWVYQASSSVPFIIDNGYDNGVRFGDVNGDGLPDAVRSWSDGVNPASQTIYLNTGDGWAATTTPAIPETFSVFNKDKGVRLVDVNGDGLVDLVRAYSDNNGTVQKVYINQGTLTWTYDASYSASFVVSADGYSRGIAISDVNADRLPDVMRSDNNGTPITETYTTQSYGTTWPAASTSPTYPESFLYNGVVSGLQLTDLNGDGLDDFSRSQQVTGETSTSTTYIRNGGSSDLLTAITLPSGGTVSYAYQSSGTIKDGSGNRLDPLPTSYDVVQSVTTNNGLGTISSSTYSYAGGFNWWGSPIDRRFAGFASVTETNPDNIMTSYFHQGNSSTSTVGEYNDSYSKIGMPFRVVTTDLSGNKYKLTITKWDEASTATAASFPYLAQTVDLAYDGGGTHRDRAVSFTYSTSTGNLTQQKDWGEVTANNDGTFSDTGTDIRTTTITYASSASSTIKNAPSDEVTTDQNSNKVKQARHYYDGLSLGSIDIGNKTKTEMWISGSTFASTTKTYNSYGLVTQSKDGKGNATSYTYDSHNLYIATSTNALSQSTAYTYDYASGKVATTTDPNGLVTAMVYDGLGRPVLLKQPDLTTPSTLVTKSTFVYVDNTLPTSVRRTDYLNSATTTDTYQYLDGLGRLIQERKTAEVSNTFTARDATYGQNGLVASESLPYFSSNSAYTSPTTTTQLFTTYAYDALRRPTNITTAVGSTTNAYIPWKTTTTDSRGKQKEFFRDALDNLVQVNEHNGASTYSTYYVYDLLGNLTKITDALGNIRNFTYDGLSRRLTAQDLHASADGTFGVYTYAYDDAGNTTQQVDPRSQTTNWTYDALNRVSTEDYTGAAGTEVNYAYDACTYGKGRLCVATTTSASLTVVSRVSYNALGIVATDTKQVAGQTYDTTYAYDRQGNQVGVVYPDRSEVAYTYGPDALAHAVHQREGAPFSWRTLVKSVTYNPLRQESLVLWGSGATTSSTYDANALYRLTRKVTILPDTGSWGTGLSGNPFGFISSNYANAASSSGATPPYVPTNLNTESLWLSNSISYDDSFENGAARWSFWAGSSSSTGSVDCTTAFGGACSYKVVVSSTSAAWMPQLSQQLRLDPNVNYTLKFKMKASQTARFEANIQQTYGQYLSLGANPYATSTTAWREYSYYFSSTATTAEKSAQMLFALGYAGAATYWIDDVELIPDQVSFVRNPSFENISDPTGNGYGYFFYAMGGSPEATWSVDCTAATDGACSRDINVLQATSTDWYVQFGQRQSIATGTTYILAFDAKSTVRRSVTFNLQQNHDPWNWLSSSASITTYPAWNHYVIEILATGGDANSVYKFNLGTTAGHVWFDNIRLFKKQDTKFAALHFNGVYDSIASSTASAYQIQVIPKGGSWASPLWDSGQVTLNPQTPVGSRTATSTYAGPALPGDGSDAGKYFWRMRVWNQASAVSPWTNGNDFFFTPGNRVQDLAYTYDANGNITRLVDSSFTKTAKAIDYTYDDLNRLTQASTTADISSGAPNAGRTMIEKWSYDALGSILTDATTTLSGGWATTTYAYAGTGYANPHAATAVGGDTLTYDNAGNQLTGAGLTKTWDWRNRLQNTAGATTTTYLYDESGARVRVGTDLLTTHYPNRYFSQEWPTNNPTRHVFLNGRSIVTFNGATSSDTLNYTFGDFLGSTGVVADSANRVQEIVDYAPYGAVQNRDQLAGYSEQRKYIGEISDATGLSYLNARYYDGGRGQFLSQDPVFWTLSSQLLMDPQQQNSYGYGRDNPIARSDPSGLLTIVIPGTKYSESAWSTNGSAGSFIAAVGKTFGEAPRVINDKRIWSGGDNAAARTHAAEAIAGTIAGYKFADGEKLNLVGHSHGGNIAIQVSQLTDRKIDNLVTLGTPVRSDYEPNHGMIGNHVNAYSYADLVQPGLGGAGGYSTHAPIWSGIANRVINSFAEFGPAGRKYDGAQNVNVTKETGYGLFGAHFDLWQNQPVWNKIDNILQQ